MVSLGAGHDVGHFVNLDTQGADGVCRVCRGVHRHLQVVKFLRQADDLRQLVVLHADEDALAGGMGVACGGKALENGFVEGPAQAQDFAGGLHFGAEHGVGIRNLLEGEDRDFDHIVRRHLAQTIMIFVARSTMGMPVTLLR